MHEAYRLGQSIPSQKTKTLADFAKLWLFHETNPVRPDTRFQTDSGIIQPTSSHSFLVGVIGHPGSVPAHTKANKSLQDAVKEQTQVYLGTQATLTEMNTGTTFNNSLGGRRA